MSLDKQKILNELGSVMTQLQSADCGCMGKLFSRQNQGAVMGSSYGGCRYGGCHGHSFTHNTACAGEPYTMAHSMNTPCMGHCNPPKLYADTYNYLNSNLMQPVVKEVYEELKSINPANTVMNNPLATQMGLANNPAQRDPGTVSNSMQNISGMESVNGNSMAINQSHANAMGGMGPQIVKMVMGDSSSKSCKIQSPSGQSGQPLGTMANAPQTYLNQSGTNATKFPPVPNQEQFNTVGNVNQQGYMNGYGNSSFVDPPTHYATQSNMYGNLQPQGTPEVNMSGNTNNYNMTKAPRTKNINNAMATGGAQQKYGQHSQGMMKFNEMFPGMMQGGDLGFDPMAIAIQMNPANQQQAAMNTMQRILNGGPTSRVTDTSGNASVMKPVTDATNAAVESPSYPVTAVQGQPNVTFVSQVKPGIAAQQQQIPPLNMSPGQQQVQNPQQQVYSAVTGQPTFNQQQPQTQCLQQEGLHVKQQPTVPSHQYNSLYISNTQSGNGGVVDMNQNKMLGSVETPPQSYISTSQPMVKEPILPAETSRNRLYTHPKSHQQILEYNMLGQPVEMLPARMFHPPEPKLPQTLSPQPVTTKLRNDHMRYSNVKSTISKTSIVGNKPVGRTPSRSQLHHLYNQYKGSQSFTQQNIRSPVEGGTFSEGKINIPTTNAHPTQIPLERVGGDTAVINQLDHSQITNKKGQELSCIGDVPTMNKQQADSVPVKLPSLPISTRQAKLRNGLQDVVHTSYPSSAAWSFHGTSSYRPSVQHNRFRNIK